MKVVFHIGKTCTNKTNLFVSDAINRDSKKDIIIITPEQSTIDMQLRLVRAHKKHCLGNVSVLSFKRLAYVVVGEVSPTKKTLISNVGKDMLIRKIIVEHTDSGFSYAKSLISKRGFTQKIRELFSELSRYMVTYENSKDKLSELSNAPLKEKTRALLSMYDSYKERLSSTYNSGEGMLESLVGSGAQSKLIRDSVIYLDGFTTFTPIQLHIINMLFSYSSEVNILLTIESDVFTNKKSVEDLYLESYETYEALMNIVHAHPDIEVSRKYYNTEAKDLEKRLLINNLHQRVRESYDEPTEKIFMDENASQKEEVDVVSALIFKKVKEEKLRYKDFIIYVPDFEKYKISLPFALNRNNVPFYVDIKRKVGTSPAVRFIFSLLELYYTGFDYNAVFSYVKSPYSAIVSDFVNHFENYVLAYGFRGLKSYENEWEAPYPGVKRDAIFYKEVIKEINDIRASIYELFSVVHFQQQERIEHYVETLKLLLKMHDFEEKLIHKSDSLKENHEDLKSANYAQIYAKVEELLDQISEINKEEIITFDDFIEILRTGEDSLEIASIPTYVDQVMIADLTRSKIERRKVAFVLGLNEGAITTEVASFSLINDSERKQLEGINIKLAPTSDVRNIYDLFNAYRAITNFDKQLFISYLSNDDDGNELHKSFTVKQIQKIFPKITGFKDLLSGADRITTEEVLFSKGLFNDYYRKLFSPYMQNRFVEAKKSNRYEISSILSENSIDKIFPEKLTLSVSRLEQYSKCPAAYFIKYMLDAKPRKIPEISAIDTGNVGHRIFEYVIEEIRKNNSFKEIDEESIDKLVDECSKRLLETDEFRVFSYSNNFRGHYNRVTNYAKASMKMALLQINCGDFKPYRTEYSFNTDNIEGIELALSGDRRLTLHGTIDRIDVASINGENYVSVLDYKKSSKDIDFNEVYDGLSTQTLIYMSAARKTFSMKPAGMLYFTFNNDVYKKNIFEEISNQDKMNKFKLGGYVLKDEAVIKAYESEFTKKSSILSVSKNYNGEFSKNSKILETNDMETVLEYVEKKATMTCEDMISGNISATPFKYDNKQGCTYCKYRGICKFNPDVHKDSYKTVEKKDDSDIIELMKFFLKKE